jgi:hypothetical protein
MQIIDYVDFWKIFEKIKKNHLEAYPTKEDYMDELKDLGEPFDYVEELYSFLNERDMSGFKCDSSDTSDDSVLNIVDGKITIEFSISGNDANESTNYNEWGYGYLFTIDLENELFVGFTTENYS